MKKLIALVLAVVLMTAFTVPAFAATRNLSPIPFKAHVTLKVYKSMNTSSDVVRTVTKGTAVEVIFDCGTTKWARARDGYVQAKNLAMTPDNYVNALFGFSSMQSGDRGTAVMNLQRALNNILNAGLSVDGVFGPATEKAVKKYQRNQQLPDDGIAGYDTQSALVASLGLPPPIL